MNCKILKAKDYIAALNKKMPKNLYAGWRERTICLVHGPREADKSTRALDIAASLSDRGEEVLFVNIDGNYREIEHPVSMVENLYVIEPEFESPDDKRDYADIVLDTIEEAVKTTSVRTVIVDSVTRIAALSFGRNGSVAHIMKRLAVLQMRYKLSLLVVAHDSTRATDRALLNYAETQIAVARPEPIAEPAPEAKQPTDGRVPSPAWRPEPVPINPSIMAVAKPQTRSNYFKKCTVDAQVRSRR